ncbi:MAG: hypothetical protein HQ481_20400 [Alphaproteobacteria bacterium]|nr:hypothetical protein [Alphaproteobacteria bacterium]
MAHADVRNAIESYLAANWPATPIAYENVDFTPPADGRFIALTIHPGQGRIASLGDGAPLWRHEGAVMLACHTPKGVGSVAALALADQVVALFRGVVLGGARFRAPSVDLDGRDEADFRAVVFLPFWWDQIG